MEGVTLYRVYYNPETKILSWFELHNLYSKPSGFFNRLHNPKKAEIAHRKAQREFVQASNTFEFDAFRHKYFIQFMFDTDEVFRQMCIENMPNNQKVNLNE